MAIPLRRGAELIGGSLIALLAYPNGNAGDYDAPEVLGFPISNPLPIQNGDAMKTFFDTHVAGISDVYFSGHDHSRQDGVSGKPPHQRRP